MRGGLTSRPYRVTDPRGVVDEPQGRANEDQLPYPDAAGLGAYPEAADADSTRHGYLPTGPAPVHLPDGGPPVRPMWRPPAGHASGGR